MKNYLSVFQLLYAIELHKQIVVWSNFCPPLPHSRRREWETKAKVVASVWGVKFIQFLAALSILTRSSWKKRLNSTVSAKSTEVLKGQRPKILPLPVIFNPRKCVEFITQRQTWNSRWVIRSNGNSIMIAGKCLEDLKSPGSVSAWAVQCTAAS